MTLNLTMSSDHQEELKPRITVFGVGGAGGNAVNNMIEKKLEGVEFVAANTDAQALSQSRATAKIQMGIKATEGLGAGGKPSMGAMSAEETIEEIVDHLAGAHMCFITAGMGGGTGTGAAPIIAQAARELGVLTVGVVTKPFQFEGAKRMRQAEEGVESLQKVVDTLIIIPNQNLFRLANEKTTFTEAFAMADDVLYQGVKGVTDLMVRPGLINLDFADVRSVMDEMGKAMMGTGEASGEDRAVQAAEKAIANPLLDEISLNGAKGVLINITGGYDMTLFELDEAANIIREKVDQDANIIVGSTLDTEMEGMIRVSVVATGIDASHVHRDLPQPRRKMTDAVAQAAEPAPAPAETAARVPLQMPPAFAPAAGAPVQEEPTLFTDPQPEEAMEDEAPAFMPRQDAVPSAPPSRAPVAREDLPPPAYRPQPQAQAPQHPAPSHDESAGDFVAPRPRPAGTPSPEAMARLAAAVNRGPGAAAPRAPAAAPQQRQQPAAQQRPAAAEKPRFGINSLINRMTGHAADPAPGAERSAAVRAQPPVTAHEEDQDIDPEQERIEIPAFLRRQAN
ncbi:cell division protein FtsZ [Solirhodobacter olei]|uniref:cell division protein FtsZ n=1 Tax=Solirhodobacter olei TaxID=2493082 RepID=UPI000FDB1902|nr:cell division protein FtsZ [Solirhodobacter olei]